LSKHDDIVAFLQGWLPAHPELGGGYGSIAWWQYHSPFQQQLPSHDDLGAELVQITEFRALQLGTWLGSTDGQVIEQAVAVVVPPLFRPQFELVVNGLKFAADLQRQHGERVAGGVALGVLGVSAILALAASGSRAA
jgi:hypothetical protein